MPSSRSMRFLVPALVAVAVVGCGAPAPEPTAGGAALNAATEEAAARGVPLLIDFYTDW